MATNDIINGETLLLIQSNFSTANVPMDSTPTNNTITIVGGDGSTITHNTGNAKFGYASLQFAGSKYLSISPPSDNLTIWDFGGGSDITNNTSFTIEFWVDMRGTSGTDYHCFFSFGNVYFNYTAQYGSNPLIYLYDGSWELYTYFKSSNNNTHADLTTGWKHVAIVRNISNGTLKLFIDGEDLTGTSTGGTSDYPTGSTNPVLYIGSKDGSYTLTGYIDCFRITNVARYTNAFDPLQFSGPWVGNGSAVINLPNNNNFTNYYLRGKDFSTHNNLNGSIFVNSDLSGSDFTNVNLSSADLTGADLTGADLSGADLSGVTWTNATLTGIKAYNLTARGDETLPANYTLILQKNIPYQIIHRPYNTVGAHLMGSPVTASTKEEAVLRAISLGHAAVSTLVYIQKKNNTEWWIYGGGASSGAGGYNVYSIDPPENEYVIVGPDVDLTDADLTNMDLTGLDLTNVTWTNTTLTGIKAYNITANGGEILPANYTWVLQPSTSKYAIIGPGVDMTDANLTDADLTGLDLTNVTWTNTIFTRTKSYNVTATGSETLPVNYTWVQNPSTGKYAIIGPDVDLTDVDLTNVDLSGVNLTNTILTNAILTGTKTYDFNGFPSTLPNNYSSHQISLLIDVKLDISSYGWDGSSWVNIAPGFTIDFYDKKDYENNPATATIEKQYTNTEGDDWQTVPNMVFQSKKYIFKSNGITDDNYGFGIKLSGTSPYISVTDVVGNIIETGNLSGNYLRGST